MKVTLLNDSFPPLIDGVANTVVNYARELTKLGDRAIVVTPEHPDADDSRFPFPVARYPSVDTRRLFGYLAGYPFSPETLRQLKEQKVDLLHSHCPVMSTILARSIRDVVDEVKMLADAGVKEVTLLGQIVNRYGRQMETAGGKGGFVQLLEAVHEVEGIQRIRFVSPHPIGFRQDLVQAFTYLPKLCSHIHFPMQSGSDRILKMMRRPYRNETYLDLCSRMKQARPDLSITTDIIVGFPGETEEDYLLTRQAVEQVQFDNAFIFRYSPRRGTPAAVMENQIPEEVKEARNQDLLAVVNEIAIRKNRDLVGTVQEVLLEGPSKTNAARLSGRTSQNKPVMVDAAPDLAGEILPIRIEESTGFTLYGVPCPSRG